MHPILDQADQLSNDTNMAGVDICCNALAMILNINGQRPNWTGHAFFYAQFISND